MNKIIIFDCGTSEADCAQCTPSTVNCPNPMLGMGVKDLTTGAFNIPVSALPLNHFIYATDGCADPPFEVGAPAFVGTLSVAPVLSARMLAVLAGALGLLGFLGLSVRRQRK